VTLQSGTRLGAYEILAPVGAGGMGEVYRAKDTKLGRDVAIKVLPEKFFEDRESIARFEREAKSLAAVSHPNIAALYNFEEISGRHLLVMELAEGQTLTDRLLKGPLPLDQLLRLAIEIALALDAAHRAGIVHRDLKPGNVMLTKSGVKMLDFGLAKAAASPIQPSELTSQPTELPKNLTEKGTILGTFQYMAPEQLEGKEADNRTDIFAFGAVLYEMATGKKAFAGSSQASLISAIMSSDPPLVSAIQPMTPPALDRVVRTCLAKDPEERWQNAHDVASELKWISEGSQAGAPAVVVSRRKARERLAWSLRAAALLVAVAALALVWRRPGEPARVVRLSLETPVKAPFQTFDHATLSPDGRLVAFIARTSVGKRVIWIRPLASLAARELAGTENAVQLFWSPSSASIGFFAEGKLKRIEASGGPPQVLCEAPYPLGGSWSRDGVILFAPKSFDVLYRVASTGGTAAPVTKLGPREDSHIWPCFLPDGKHFVFLADASNTSDHSIRLGSLDTPESEKLVAPAVTNPGFAPPDWLLFVRAGTLVAQRLDVANHRLTGDAVPLGEQIAPNEPMHGFEFSASQTGVLLYRSEDPDSQLVWFDRTGRRLATVGEPIRYARFELAPNERQVAYEKLDADGRHGNLWLLDLERGSTSRLTSTPGSDYGPIWSPDGRKILFASSRSGLPDLFEITSGGGSAEKLVFHDAQDKNPLDWSRDGRFALFVSISPATSEDIWILPLSEGGKPAPLVATRFSEIDAQISPDGRWFAYSSDESGRPEVYVQSISDASRRYQVSTSGGSRPRWRGDGKELFFFAGSLLQAADVRLEPGFEAGKPKDLFRLPVWSDYAIARDGQRILVATSVDANPFVSPKVVLNFTWELPGR